ncbi:MAG: flagellar basal body P-ring formation protein FlgA [Deltaproteobacteria bacterium]|nr:flagellar basal body P-ring formation protein FlgA [Deltaproteobacteria bacterium]
MFLIKEIQAAGFFLRVAVIVLLFASEAFCSTIHVNVPGDVEVKGEEVTLGQIAKIRGDDQKMIQRLGEVVIAKAPGPGQTLSLRREDILSMIRRNPDLSLEIYWELPETVTIRSDHVLVSKEKIIQWVTEAILLKINWPKDRVKVHPLSPGQDLLLPRGKITHEIFFPRNGFNQRVVPVGVLFRVDGKICRRIWVNTRIDLYQPVVVAVKPMAKGTIIGPDDVGIELRPMRNSRRPVLTDLNQAAGKRTKRAIHFSQPISADLLEVPPLVTPGKIVRIIAEKDMLRVSTIGQVKGKGGAGDMVRVMNLVSKKIVYGVVVDSKTVKVEF